MLCAKRSITAESVINRRCGISYPSSKYYPREREYIRAATEKIANQLEIAGIPARTASRDIFIIGEVTGGVERISTYRRIHLLPEFSQSHKSKLIRQLTYFLNSVPSRNYYRYAVITSGDRVPWFSDLDRIRKRFIKNIARWSSEARAKFGVEVLLRSEEMTFRKSNICAQDGVHLHANIVYRMERRVSPQKWRVFLKWSRQRVGSYWRDCGPLRSAQAVARYVMKLSTGKCGVQQSEKERDYLGIDELIPLELAWIYAETFRKSLVRCYGTFAKFRKKLIENSETINCGNQIGKSPTLYRVKHKRRNNINFNKTSKIKPKNNTRKENVVIGRTLPQPRFSDVFETCSIVLGLTNNPTTPLGVRGLNIIRIRAKQAARLSKRNSERQLLFRREYRSP